MQASEKDKAQQQEQVVLMLKTLERVRENIAELKKEAEALREENKHLNRLLRIQKNSIKELEREAKTRKLAAVMSKKDKTSAKHTLNSLIEEIDRCIKLVNGSMN